MLVLPPELTHEIAAGFARDMKRQMQSQPGAVVVDASALQTFDSSALAVLLAYRREALASSKAFSVQGLPPRLRQLATLYGVAELVPPAP